MFWNLEIHSGKQGEKLEYSYDSISIKPQRFDIPTKGGLEFGFNAYNSIGLIERIGLASLGEDERVSVNFGSLTIKGINIALISTDSRRPEDEEREYAHGIYDWGEDLLIRSRENPELYRQWTLTADFGNAARALAEYSETGNNAALRNV